MYPRLEINTTKLRRNAKIISQMCHSHNLNLAFVTKSFCAREEVVQEIVKEDIDYIADSRIKNLKNLKDIKIPKILLRIPMISEIEDVIKCSDISFNSELDTIKALNNEAKANNIIHKIVIMYDLGDLREGYFYKDNLFEAIKEIVKLENIKIMGIATNLTCYGAIIPSNENLSELVSVAREIEKRFNINLEIISGGNSSSIYLLNNNTMPKGVNNLRVGEAILLGRETAYGNRIEGTYEDVFKLVCEIIECKEKPSIPVGEIGVDAFGKKPIYTDKGILKRAIIAIGRQDINMDSLIPLDKEIEILGCSSDHMILDVSNCRHNYKIGDKVEFMLTYGGIMSTSTSNYVEKKVIS
ncbi:ornithine racemase Orr [Intestinibacter sp.]